MDKPRIKKAVAIKYKKYIDDAPKVVAKGQNLVAEKIQDIAKEHKVHIEKDAQLADELYKLSLNEEIPEELYEAVAKILMFLYNL
jgi:flagellar biosynthesis protein